MTPQPFKSWKSADLWPHQRAAIETVLRYVRSGSEGAALIRMPTGTGKTGVMAVLAQLIPSLRRILVVAPWAQLTGQIANEIAKGFWVKAKVPQSVVTKPVRTFTPATLEKALLDTTDEGVLICTNQSLALLNASFHSLHKQLSEWTSLALIDEGHREPAPRWAMAIRELGKPSVLFSATPYRNDHRLFAVDVDHVYRFPHADAVAQRFIRRVEFQETDWGNSAKGFVRALQQFVNTRVLPAPPKDFPNPRIVVRCATSEDVENVANELRRLGEEVVGIHETFDPKTQEILVRNVPEFAASSARYWVHQFKLLEGVDDPSFCATALFQPFGSARALVQQIGRVVRNPYNTPKQTAWVFTSPRHRQRAMWEAYLAFEGQTDAAVPLDPKAALTQVLQATYRLEYLDGNYRAQYDPGAPDLHRQFRFALAANAFVVGSSFQVAPLAEDMRALLDEEDLVVSGESAPDRQTRFIAYARFQSSDLLLDRAFPELNLGFCIARRSGRFLFYYDTSGLLPESVSDLPRVEPIELERLLAGTDARISAVSLLNSDLAHYSVRRRTMSARSVGLVAPSLADHAHFCSTASGVVESNAGGLTRRYVGFSRSRVSEHSGRGVEYEEFARWTDDIAQALDDENRELPELFDRYAVYVKSVKSPEATHILFDLDELDISELAEDLGDRSQLQPIRFDELCWDVASDGTFEIVSANRRIRAKVSFDETTDRYTVESPELADVFALPGRSGESGHKLLSLLNRAQAFRIVTADGHVFAHGSFYRARVPLWGGKKRNRIELESILEPCIALNSVSSEKGGRGSASGNKWGKDSLFALIDEKGPKGLLGQYGVEPDYMVCDDLGNELADFIAFTEHPRRVVLVHAKVDHKNGVTSASAFQEVCGQAVKNLDLLVPQCEREPKDLSVFTKPWKLKPIGTVDSRTRVNRQRLSPTAAWTRLQELVRHPETQREVWIVVGQGLSLQAFKNARAKDKPPGRVIQLIYLLQSTWNSVSSTGAKLRVFVRP